MMLLLSLLLLLASCAPSATGIAPLEPHDDLRGERRRRRRRRRRPLRVFVLVGQSNMVGHGICSEEEEEEEVAGDGDGSTAAMGRQVNGTLDWLVQNVPSQYGMLKSADGTEWTERPDVWIAVNKQDIGDMDPVMYAHGNLRAGYGGDRHQQGQLGPELGFGWAVGDGLNKRGGKKGKEGDNGDDKVLLLKIAWGGRSLAVDFRPPSSGKEVGPYYDAVLTNVKVTLSNLTSLFPSHDERAHPVVISGFAWHQGWNDGCDVQMTAEYEYNLANLIRDIRTDLGVPDLPVSIGVSGMAGYEPGRRTDIVDAQLAVANATKYPEFGGTVASVETRHFRRDPKPHSPSDMGYHWNSNAESYWLVGQAMGKAMVELVLRRESEMEATETAAEGSATALIA